MAFEYINFSVILKRFSVNRDRHELKSIIWFHLERNNREYTSTIDNKLAKVELEYKTKTFIDSEINRLLRRYIKCDFFERLGNNYDITIRLKNVGNVMIIKFSKFELNYDEIFKYIKHITNGRLITLTMIIHLTNCCH